MMHMTMYWSKQVTLLVDSWTTNSWPTYLLTLLACFLFSSFHQYMEALRISHRIDKLSSLTPSQSSVAVPLITKFGGHRGRLSPGRLATAVLFGVNSAIGYLLMLTIMSFNGGVFLSVVFGLSFGYLLFRCEDADAVVVDNTCACA